MTTGEQREGRAPQNEADLRFWLENMAWYHRYTLEEMAAATGMLPEQIETELLRLNITPENRPIRSQDAPLRILPYPGGRHPRLGFLEGAVSPQRETKVSIFAPWDDASYVVADVPEAIWMDGPELLYLAHDHDQALTLWRKQGVTLPQQEWIRHPIGSLLSDRTLPNGVAFGATILPGPDGVRMALWFRNGSNRTLTGLRVQNCILLRGMAGFTMQTNDNKRFASPFALVHNEDKQRWILTAWDHPDRLWANPPCPCLHSDPKFPDCAPGDTKSLRGWLSFYTGAAIEAEMRRIQTLGWLRRTI